MEKLTEQLEFQHEELQCVREKLDECRTVVDQLKDACKRLETDAACDNAKLEECQAAERRLQERCRELEADVKAARAKLEDAKSRAVAAEARLRAEADVQAEELECGARKLREAEAECEEWQRRVADERCKANRACAAVAELRAAVERERCETEAREQRLRRDVCGRAEEARRLDEQLTATRRENEVARSAAAALETRVRTTEGLLEDARRSGEAWERAQAEARERLECEKAALLCEVRRKAAEVAELERRVSRLREELKRAGDDSADYCHVGGPATVTCGALPPTRVLADDLDMGRRHVGGVVADDSFVGRLKRLYCDLELNNKNTSRRH